MTDETSNFLREFSRVRKAVDQVPAALLPALTLYLYIGVVRGGNKFETYRV